MRLALVTTVVVVEEDMAVTEEEKAVAKDGIALTDSV